MNHIRLALGRAEENEKSYHTINRFEMIEVKLCEVLIKNNILNTFNHINPVTDTHTHTAQVCVITNEFFDM